MSVNINIALLRFHKRKLVLWQVLWSVLGKSSARCRVNSTLLLPRWELTSGVVQGTFYILIAKHWCVFFSG